MLALQDVTVRYGQLVANDRVSLDVAPGEVHALLGENGAGKTTLVKVLAGLVRPDTGTVVIDGRSRSFASALDAMASGIGVVHQHFMLIPTMTVAENVCLGLRAGPLPRLREVAGKLTELGKRFGLGVDPDALVDDLSVGQRQRVEILKALYRGARILILDEPTAVLTPSEVDSLVDTIRELAANGTSIVFISHKLDEVRRVSDRVTVLRHGAVVARRDAAGTTERELAELMVGRPVELDYDVPAADPADVVLRTTGLTVESHGRRIVDEVSMTVRAGQILGIAAVEGNGQHELVEAVVGLRRVASGTIHLHERDVTGASVRERLTAGLAHIPEDRGRTALAESLSVQDNLMATDFADPRFARSGWTRRRAARQHATELVERFDVRCRGIGQPVGQLSGGNQQKIVVARELSRGPSLLVAVHPTRGLDIGAAEYVHRRLLDLRAAGGAVLLLSAELDEVLGLADQVCVMYEGKLSPPVPRGELDMAALGLLMAGRA